LPQIRDLFFEDFYGEHERVIKNIKRRESETHQSKLLREVPEKWIDFVFKLPKDDLTLISVDGVVQF